LRRLFAAPHRQLAVLVVGGIVLAISVVGLTLVNLTNVREPLDRADPRLLTAAGSLQASAQDVADTGAKFATALTMPPAERSVLAASLADANSRYHSQFARYEANAMGLPGERALQQDFEKKVAASTDLSVALLTPEVVSADQIAQAATITAEMQSDLQQLQGLYQAQLAAQIHQARAAEDTTRRILVTSAGIALFLVLGAGLALVRTLRRQEAQASVQDARNELESRLQRALEMAETEDDVYRLVATAMTRAGVDRPAELLIADSSRAHLHQVASAHMSTEQGCAVTAPTACPAAVSGQTQRFASSRDLDACPYLVNRPDGPCAAACVPVNIAGRAMGVIHARGPDRQPSSLAAISDLELVARRAGERLSLLRAFARSEMQANTDPLTGLLNRRSLEAATVDLVEEGDDYVVAYADLDHFKTLNDVHGHDAGDRALRVFARVLRDSVRPSDVPARYGGEEFIVVLPHCSPADAETVMERVRARLAVAVREEPGPAFTVSVGIAASQITKTFGEVVEAADMALLEAKANGRDRVVVAPLPGTNVPDDPSSITPNAPR
jgi:diguanylate cyclase (GGDEF)-like protein